MENKIYQMLALSNKARKLVAGEFTCKQTVLAQKAYLIIVATDASDNTKKLFKDKTAYRKIPYVEWGTKERLGQILGKEIRAVVAILDIHFATRIQEMIGR